MTQNNLISIVTMWNKVNESSRENLSQRHEKETKKSGRNDRKQIWNWNFMRRMQGRKGLSAASLSLKTLSDNSECKAVTINR